MDDNIETLKKRLKVFNELNLPVMNYYQAKNKVRPVIFKRHSNIFFLEPFFNTYSVDHKFFFGICFLKIIELVINQLCEVNEKIQPTDHL